MDRRHVINMVTEQKKHYDTLGVSSDKQQNSLDVVAVNAISELTEALVESINSSSISYDMLAEGMFKGIYNQHNFLQGEFWIAMEKTIRKYSEMEYVDGRNSFAKDMCGAFIKGNDERIA